MKQIRATQFISACLFVFSLLVLPASADDSIAGSILYPDFDAADVRDHWVEAELGPTTTQLTGELQVDEELGDTNVDVDETLDLEDGRNGQGRVEFQPFGGTHIRLGFRGMRFQETTTLSRNITVDGTTYNASESVDSELILDTYEVGYRVDAFSMEYLVISPMIQANVIDFSAQLDNETTGQSVSEESVAAIPYPGVRVEFFPFPRAGGFAEARGISGTYSNTDFTSIDVEGGVQVNFTQNILIRVGYRKITYDLERSDTNLDLEMGGPYATFAINF